MISRFGSEIKRNISGKMLAIFNHFINGIPLVYQGEEIGMLNWPFKFEEINDVDVLNHYQEYVVKKKVYTHDEFFKIVR